ncbi:MAG: GNAT family N-acetyltransferase [Proteobacteria bacterium]|nr:GNAT family N-acetyltransferase [Pseudomonadota bacterium]MDA0952573.1 GNAT family N-acetyltransferase [Pseudomonadota bacterium]MDA1070104.1 GNAT family N-acetyltransferase [Pseudomonadota bacterium]
MMPVLRPLLAQDAGWFLALNNAAVPHVNALDGAALAALLEEAAWTAAVEHDGRPAGGLIAFGPGAAYASPNYRWFDARHADFLYVDRVVVDAACRGAGLGRALYGALRDHASGRTPLLACEVNEQPPNPASMAFHERFGFAAVGRQETEGGTKRVALMEMPLA